KTTTIFGHASLNDLGPSLIMPDAILDRIVDAAHHCKVNSIQDLKRETGWTDSYAYGDDVVTIIRRHAIPLPSPFVTTPLRLNASTSIAGPSDQHSCITATKRCNKCSACGQEGHNARNRVCHNHPQR
ncbi:hypothetical protein PAXRUDRAFT_123326, partial [Paxillus rubicundulus Ve08.2h10]